MLLTIGACAAGFVATSLAVLVGAESGALVARPALAGLLLSGIASVGTALTTLLPAAPLPRSVVSSVAIGTSISLALVGFLYGPLAPHLVSTVPLLALLASARAGRTTSVLVLLAGLGVGGGLLALGLLDLIPLAPALVTPPSGGTYPAMLFALLCLSLAMGPGLAEVAAPSFPLPPDTEIDTVVPAPPRTTRTGSFSIEELRLFDSDQSPVQVGDDSLEVQKLESLGVLAGGVAHDFNNLLMSILGNTSLALNDTERDHPAHEPLREIETASRRARDLVGQLLAYAGKGGAAPSPVDLNQLVREMGDLLQTAMKARARVDYDLCSGTPVVMGDPTQLRQVVMNLITNAGDAMKGRQGAVHVSSRLRRVEDAELRETLLGAECSAGAYVVLEVRDEGCGMDAATLERIFDPFYTTKRTGRGLGLAAVLGIVRRYGGTMEVESRLDEGTLFRLFLPYASSVDEEEDFVTDHTATARGWTPGQAAKVLLVDDDPVVRMVTGRMLQRLGLEVHEAVDGTEAIASIEADADVQAAVVDMTMPGMNGLDTVAELRRRVPGLPVLIVSGYSEDEVPPLDNGLFLQKPYTLKQLTQALDEVLTVDNA